MYGCIYVFEVKFISKVIIVLKDKVMSEVYLNLNEFVLGNKINMIVLIGLVINRYGIWCLNLV